MRGQPSTNSCCSDCRFGTRSRRRLHKSTPSLPCVVLDQGDECAHLCRLQFHRGETHVDSLSTSRRRPRPSSGNALPSANSHRAPPLRPGSRHRGSWRGATSWLTTIVSMLRRREPVQPSFSKMEHAAHHSRPPASTSGHRCLSIRFARVGVLFQCVPRRPVRTMRGSIARCSVSLGDSCRHGVVSNAESRTATTQQRTLGNPP